MSKVGTQRTMERVRQSISAHGHRAASKPWPAERPPGRRRSGVAKLAPGELLPSSNAIEETSNTEVALRYSYAGALQEPYDFDVLEELAETSSLLRPAIDAYVVNIDGYGHRYEPVVDLSKPGADEKVADLIRADRVMAAGDLGQPNLDVSPEEVAALRAQIERESRVEKLRLESFFTSCNPERSWVELRKLKREEQERTGNAYWEILPDALGRPAQVNYVPAYTVRLLPLDREPVTVDVRVKTPSHRWVTVRQSKRFRRFVQVFTTVRAPTQGRIYQTVFFKEWGDPRTLSSRTGRYYRDLEDLTSHEGKTARPATPLYHFRVHNPRTVYGVPRWIGALLAAWGTRLAEEVNFDYFDNKALPAFLFLLAGGQFTEESMRKVEEFFENKIKGRENFHKGLFVEAEPLAGAPGAEGRMRLEVKPLLDAQTDALFLNYMERNGDLVGKQFRISRILLGDSRDFNRATAQAALDYAEKMVFGPERDGFDFWVDRTLFAWLGVRWWRFVSNGPSLRDPEKIVDMSERLAAGGVISVNEAREAVSDPIGRDLPRVEEPWADQPGGARPASGPEQPAGPAVPGGGVEPAPAAPGPTDDDLLALVREAAGKE